MTLYDVICEMGKAHCRIAMKNGGYSDLMRFNLTRKSLKNGDFFLIKDGEVVVDKLKLNNGQTFSGLQSMKLIDIQQGCFKENLERLYIQYHASRPSMRCRYSKSNFVAKHETELSFEEMLGKDRTEAMYELEAYVLLSAMAGVNIPAELGMEEKHYYWKSEFPSLVMFRDWM